MTRATARGVLGTALAFVVLAPSAARAQAVPDSATAEVDSTRLAILERLQRLARPVGADSLIFVQDSARLAEAAAGRRPGTGIDSIATSLMAMPGFSLTEYEGREADFAASERILVLQAPADGRARVTQEGIEIRADSSITFNEATGSMRTRGDATFTPTQGDPVDAANLVYDLNQARGTALGARTTYDQQGTNWIVRGDMQYVTQDSTFAAETHFTSCELEVPHYHFQTDEIKLVGGNLMVARGVKLYFADVPVAWLPFIAQSITTGRRSGLLTPQFSVNDIVRTSGGYRRRLSNLGFYWAASQYADATVAMDWFSETFFALSGALRYNVRRQFLNGDVTFKKFWNEDGSYDLALDTRHSWEIDERTQLRASARYVTSTDFVRENSFNPQEVTQSIDSEAGLNRRFDWGSLSASASRREYLSDDRVEWLLPSANLSLSPITLFRAPSSEAGVFNNMTWSGSAGLRRNSYDRAQADTFDIASIDNGTVAGNVRSTLNVGNLSFTQSADLTRDTDFDIPEAYLLLGDSADAGDLVIGAPARNVSEETLGWSLGLGYQQRLIGSTTLTPRLSMNGRFFRSDTSSLAQSFVAAPHRVSFGAQLKTDMYGFYPGVGPFEAIRHKFSPSFDYSWSPETTPNDLQRQVFNSRALQPQNVISVSLTQTWEAKRRVDESADTAGLLPIEPDSLAADSLRLDPYTGAPGGPARGPADPRLLARGGEEGPRRLQQNPAVTLLAWRTSVIRYDFVQADSAGSSLLGFETTRLQNQFTSDYLRGLSISMDHELWIDDDDGAGAVTRRFDPHLSNLNLGFSLGSRSSIFRWLAGLAGGGDGAGGAGERAAGRAGGTAVSRRPSPTHRSRSTSGIRRTPPRSSPGSTGTVPAGHPPAARPGGGTPTSATPFSVPATRRVTPPR